MLIPLVVLLAGGGIAILVAQTGGGKPAKTPPTTGGVPAEIAEAVPGESTPIDTEPDANEPDTAQPSAIDTPSVDAGEVAAPIEGLHAQVLPAPVDLGVIGSDDPDSGYEVRAAISPLGGGIDSLSLTDYYETLERVDHVTLQETQPVKLGDGVATAVPFALTAVVVDGTRIDLTSGPNGEQVWSTRAGGSAGELEATIVDGAGSPVLRIERTLSVEKGSHIVQIAQRAENLTNRPLTIKWVHTGPMSFETNSGGYGGDKRRVRFGYWLNPESQASDPAVLSNEHMLSMTSVINVSKAPNGAYAVPATETLWPNTLSDKKGHRLVWLGITGRYFGVALAPWLAPNAADKTMPVERVTRVTGLDPSVTPSGDRGGLMKSAVVLTLVDSRPMVVPPAGSASFDLGAFVGPLSRGEISTEPQSKWLGLEGLVIYNFGGMCAFCTFQWLAQLLLSTLRMLDGLTSDWGVAIIILVLIVRTVLHPINRWSQIRVQRFGAQMQGIQPKMAKLKEKYKDDQKRLQQETTKLWKEEGINPAGMLGCLPMFLQSPVWIALYATLYFAVELRHEPAFYGVFQQIGGWQFLADLSRSDNAIQFAKPLSVFGFFHISAINLLPILLGGVFYFHQKFLTPPTTTTMTPEQESTQKMVKVMSVVMFPVFMYAAPSGLSLYFITNSTLAIFENKWIRHHMQKHGLLDPDKIREQTRQRRESGGFMARLQQLAAERQNQQQASNRMMRRVKNVAPEKPDRNEPRFKKRK